MFHEFAVEPAAIGSNWESFRYLIEKFGFDKGRLISRFPSKWEKQVIGASEVAGMGDSERKRLIEKLREKKSTALIKTGRDYDPELQNWMENARASHAMKPFKAIISSDDTNPEEYVINVDDCDDDHVLFTSTTSENVLRTAEELSNLLFPLALAAKEIDIVDPFFDLSNRNGDYVEPLTAMLNKLSSAGVTDKILRIHFRTHPSRSPDHILKRDAFDLTKSWLPDGFALELLEWEERPGGEDFHDRFFLCDCGGLMVGAGLAAVRDPQTATISLLSNKHVQNLRARFATGATTYGQVGRTVRIKSGETAEFI